MGQLKLLPAATQITDGSTGQTAATSATWFSGTRPLPAVSQMEVGAILATAVTRTIPTATTSATIPLAATIPATVVVDPTTRALPGLKPSSAVLPTTDFLLSRAVRGSMI